MSTIRTLKIVAEKKITDRTLDEHAAEMNTLQIKMLDQNYLIRTLTHAGEIKAKVQAIDKQLQANLENMAKAYKTLRENHAVCEGISKAEELVASNILAAVNLPQPLTAAIVKTKIDSITLDLNGAIRKTNSLRKLPLPILSFIASPIAEIEKSLAQLKNDMDVFALAAKTPSGLEFKASNEKIYESFQQDILKMKVNFEKMSEDHGIVSMNCKKAKTITAGLVEKTKTAATILHQKIPGFGGDSKVFNNGGPRPASPTASPRAPGGPNDSDSGSDSDSDNESSKSYSSNSSSSRYFNSSRQEGEESLSPVSYNNQHRRSL